MTPKVTAGIAVMNEWVDADERLPSEGKNVFVLINGRITVGAVDGYGQWGVDNDLLDDIASANPLWDDEYFPSHWMPLIVFPGWGER